MSATGGTGMQLFGTCTSPYTRIVRIMAIELGYDLPLCEIRWRQTPEKLFAINPRGRIPVLVDMDVLVTESRTIVEYLWEKAGGQMPRHTDLRNICESRWEEEAILSDVYGVLEAIMLLRGMAEPPAIVAHPYLDRSKERIGHCFAQLDSKAGRGYLVKANTFGIAEAALVAASDAFETYGFGDLDSYSSVCAMRARLAERQSIAKTRPTPGTVSPQSAL